MPEIAQGTVHTAVNEEDKVFWCSLHSYCGLGAEKNLKGQCEEGTQPSGDSSLRG